MLQGEQLQLALEAVKDALVGVPFLTRQNLLHFEDLEEPQMQSILLRYLQQTAAYVENLTKLSLSPRRKTDLPGSVREAYEHKSSFERYFQSHEAFLYPIWDNLTAEQQFLFQNDQFLYRPGTLAWDVLTTKQIAFLTSQIIHDTTKSGPEEKLDGQNRALIILNQRNIIKIHSFRLEARNGSQLGIPFLNRNYDPKTELILYPESGEVQVIPFMAWAQGVQTGGLGNRTSVGFGQRIIALPQILHVDYSYGYQIIPLDLMRAVAVMTAIKIFLALGLMLTKGLLNFSVQGFSAGFGQGLYKPIMDMYDAEARSILENYRQPAMSSWSS